MGCRLLPLTWRKRRPFRDGRPAAGTTGNLPRHLAATGRRDALPNHDHGSLTKSQQIGAGYNMDPRDPLDRLEDEAVTLANRATWETQNRRALLWIHATLGLTAGLQMLFWGSATTIETAVGVWSRSVLVLLATGGGASLIWGLSRRPRSIPFEVVGLFLVLIWDALMAMGLLFARIQQDDYRIIPLNQALAPGYVVAYASSVYVALFAMICVHLSTLRKIKRKATR